MPSSCQLGSNAVDRRSLRLLDERVHSSAVPLLCIPAAGQEDITHMLGADAGPSRLHRVSPQAAGPTLSSPGQS